MESCGAKGIDKGRLLQAGDKQSPAIVPKKQVEIEQLCVSTFFIHGFKGIWVGAGGKAVPGALGKVAKQPAP